MEFVYLDISEQEKNTLYVEIMESLIKMVVTHGVTEPKLFIQELAMSTIILVVVQMVSKVMILFVILMEFNTTMLVLLDVMEKILLLVILVTYQLLKIIDLTHISQMLEENH